MRPVVVVCAVVAGTAARMLWTKFSPLVRERRRRLLGREVSETTETRVSVPSGPPLRKCIHHHQVLTALNLVAPIITGAQCVEELGTDRDCSFCLEMITHSISRVRVTPCRHAFHAECLEQWINYTANAALDWRNYIVADDGSVDIAVTPPSCPNCSAKLRVIPGPLVRNATLTAVARSLSLPDVLVAAHMFNSGLVYRTPNTWSFISPHVSSTGRPQTFSLARSTPGARTSYFFSPVTPEASPQRIPDPFGSEDPSSSLAQVTPPSMRIFERNAWRQHENATALQISSPFVVETST